MVVTVSAKTSMAVAVAPACPGELSDSEYVPGSKKKSKAPSGPVTVRTPLPSTSTTTPVWSCSPDGSVSCYEWTKPEGPISEDMKYFFEMEGLTYALETPETYQALFRSVGFGETSVTDGSNWYRRRSREEYELIKGDMYAQLVETIGQKDADHFVKDWRSMVVVCEKGELKQTYCRAHKR